METNREDNKLTIKVSGRLDTTTAPAFEKEIMDNIEGVKELVFDFSSLDYISSAGLRVLLKAKKIMLEQGTMTVTGCNEEIITIFEITGFRKVLDM